MSDRAQEAYDYIVRQEPRGDVLNAAEILLGRICELEEEVTQAEERAEYERARAGARAEKVARLEARVRELEETLEELSTRPDWVAYNALLAERDRLREALERVAYYSGVYRCKERRAIARQALGK